MQKKNTSSDQTTSPHKISNTVKSDLTTPEFTGAVTAELLMQNSETKFLHLFEISPVGIVLVGFDKQFIRCNPEFLNFLGYEEKDLIGKNIEDITLTEDCQVGSAEMRSVLKGEISKAQVQKRYLRKDGQVVWAEVTISLIRDSNSQPQCFLGVIQDITERKMAEKVISQSEEKFRILASLAPAGIYLTKPDGTCLYTNPAWQKMAGLKEEEALGFGWINGIHPDDRVMVSTNWQKMVESQGEWGLEYRFQNREGITTLVYGVATTQKDSSGNIVGYVGVNTDITEFKKIEEALTTETNQRLILMEQSRDGIVILDKDGKVYESNRAFAEMLGYPLEKMYELSVFDWEFLYPRETIIEMIQKVDEKGDHFESKHRRKDGSIYDVEISTNAALFEGHKLIFCVCRDITERKKIEQDLYLKSLVLDQIQDHVTITDLQGNITYVNQAEKKLLGLPGEQLVGKTTSIYGENAEKGATQHEIVENTLQNGFFQCEVVNYSKDGSEHTMDCRTQVIRDSDGKPVALCGISTDITERKKIEESLILSEEKFSKAFKISPDSININRINDGLYMEVNEGFTQLTGYTADDVEGKTSHEINIWGNPQDRERLVKELREKGEVHNLEAPFRIKGGEIKICLMSARVINVNGDQCILSITRDITERKQAEQAISESEEKYRILFEQNPDGVVILEQETGQIIEFNDQACRQLGYTREEYANLRVADIEAVESAEDVHAHIQNIIDSGHDEFETQHRTSKGEIRDIQVFAQVVKMGNHPIFHCIWRDITDRKQAENKLIESEKKFSRIFNDAPVWIAISDIDTGTYLEVNDEALRASGFSREEVIGHSAVEIGWISTMDRQRLFQAIVDHGRTTDYEMTFHTKDGQELIGLLNVEQIEFNGRSCILTTAVDITERKQEQEKLKESEENLKKAQQYAHIGSWSWSPATNQLEWSDEMFWIFGIKKETFTGELREIIEKAIHPEDRVKVDESNLSVIKYGKPIPVEYRIIWPDQSIHTVWAEAGEMIKDETGSVVKLSGTVQDITERKEAEQRMIENLNELKRWYTATLDREDRVMELKQEVNELLLKNGLPPRYNSVEQQ